MTARGQGPTAPRALRFVLLPLAFLALVMGLLSGLARLGWDAPATSPTMALAHGPLMIAGFLGTLIGLERAVALDRVWVYGAPLLVALGGIALAAGIPSRVGITAVTLGSALFLAVTIVVAARQPALFAITMAIGAAAWLGGNALWLSGREIRDVVPLWVLFPVLTIAGERVELSRVLRPGAAAHAIFMILLAVLIGGAVMGLAWPDLAWRVLGAGLLALTGWLFRHDLARRTIRMADLPRFAAACLLSGYVWLGVAGLLALTRSQPFSPGNYDAILHAVFLGFVFAMIFGHAPIILPAITRLAVPFRGIFYGHLGLLHISLALRLSGDLLGWHDGRRWGGLLNAAAIIAFLVITASAVIGARTARKS